MGICAIAILPIGVVVEYSAIGFIVGTVYVDLVCDVGRGIETSFVVFGYIVACKEWAVVFICQFAPPFAQGFVVLSRTIVRTRGE